MNDERAKYEESKIPSFLEDEYYDHTESYQVLVPIDIWTLEKIFKIKTELETVPECINRLILAYESSHRSD